MNKLIVASNNQGKIKEIKEILKNFQLEVFSLKDLQIDIDVVEDGSTFMENAYKKAKEIYNITKGYMVLADDSGLMVDALNGAPGVLSARFSGEHGNDEKNNEKLISMLKGKGKGDRKARFVCALVLIMDNYEEIKVQEQVEGIILEDRRGKDGFGYDPLFYIPEIKKTFAEMTSSEKNSISHRGRALNQLKQVLNSGGYSFTPSEF
ncbi:Non-canonical purine NTP pyrophosphatase [Clostridium pasteurianum DSM 525 = ATCC 6013]|uniref:dITP/XTP pyrophosphatase n=1 Tax=Clostridium pasteurianum DSM 525 = ATCC 6013 TaxID=1262449 RepID=A0A0H3J8P5_CLOPA|nr:XTP/dITP diphosphatase [Clostridium pasteurianum]AJA47445.1 Non-canonical purine NTP pyrophosphatase [Clostridium pasteurianum DSM 525 = ATCC 6013]AJA51433.1 Non-canonical purine NTP pyrophosphatase [Clostridium pasteurianum DSM 525 = ATCC 6013]AOZ74771.1 non-canonical purine NTP pyrophosphatase [Clostridium pasteurianum DSM 525 = ATCC 6013]AOZ78567.1 non-canonical purine NTP pyrophosphatase [Clostridium pasteurianum]ELP58780.1 dITP/XTP pyrophosphatase [Clostridium pasteurianum DSM 525 = AT